MRYVRLLNVDHQSLCDYQGHNEVPSIPEIIYSIKALKSNKVAGFDGIAPELLKADPDTTARILPLVERFWNTETLPQEL